MRKLKKGSGKYKGKLPFKCFNCGKIRNFASKCPYGEKDGDKKKSNKSFGKDKMKKTYGALGREIVFIPLKMIPRIKRVSLMRIIVKEKERIISLWNNEN